MGSKPSSQTQTSQTYSPPPQVMAEYQNVVNKAQSVAATPYQAYSGQLVAPVNQQQTTGINAVNSAAGIQDPYNTNATGLATSSAGAINPTQFSAQQVQQYESPYNNDVINATLAEIQNQNQQQASSLTGNAISSGAFGGDRAGVAQAALAGQQDLATNQTIANLNNQNYQQALSEFNTQQQTGLAAAQNNAARQLAASQQLGTLGTTAQNEALNEANAQTNAGTLQQTTQQNQDTAAYNQYLQQLAYPFQTTGWLANIVEGIGSQSGGTSTGVNTQESNSTNSILGGLIGLGSFLARGGRVPKMASGGGLGGGVYGDVFNPTQPTALQGLGGGQIVPTPSLAIGHTMPQGTSMGQSAAPQTAQSIGANIAGAAKGVQGLGNGLAGLTGNLPGGDYSQTGAAAYGLANGLDLSDIGFARGGATGLAGALYKKGGVVLGDAGLMRRPHFDDGGTVSPDALMFDPSALGTTDPSMAPSVGLVPQAPAFAKPPTATDVVPVGPAVPDQAVPAVPTTPSAPSPAPTGDPTFARMINTESGGRQFDGDGNPLLSPKGAVGVAQVMPGTAPEAAKYAGLAYDPTRLATDAEYNAALGKAYYDHQLATFGTPDKAAAAYNAGPGAVTNAIAQADQNGGSYLDYLPAETQSYVAKAMGLGGGQSAPTTALAYADDSTTGSLPSTGGLGAIGRALSGPIDLHGSTMLTPPGNFVPGASPAGHSGLLGLNLSDNTRLGLLAAGLGIMGSPSMNVGQAIGQGGLQGLQAAMQGARQNADIGLNQARTNQITTETQMKQQQLQLMMKALENNARIFKSGSVSSGGGANTPSLTAPTVTSGTSTAGNAAVAPKQIAPQYDPTRLRAAAENMSFVNPQAAANYRDQASQIESGKALVQFSDGSWGFMPGYSSAAASTEAEKETAKDTAAKTVDNQFAAGITPSGAKYLPLSPSSNLQPNTAGASAPVSLPTIAGTPPQMRVDPKTAQVVTAIPAAPPGGGYPASDVPAGAKMTELGNAAKNVQAADKQFDDLNGKLPLIDQGIARYQSLAEAFKMFSSGSQTDHLQGAASLAASLGQKGLAQRILGGDPAALQWVEKEGVPLALETAKSANPKFAQSEFKELSSKAVPNPSKLPEANHEVIAEGLGLLERNKAFISDWQTAQQNGWQSPSAFYSQWTKANPINGFIGAAQRQIGNFSGMNLPPANEWTAGVTYFAPKNMTPAQIAAFAKRGIAPGQMFRWNGADAASPLEPVQPRNNYSNQLQ